MMFKDRAKLFDINRLGIVNKEHRMRIADIDTDRIRQTAQGQRNMVGINRLTQRDIAPVQLDLPHIDGDTTIGQTIGIKQSDDGLDNDILAAKFAHDDARHTARGIATGLDLAPVIVANAHEGIGKIIAGGFDHDQLITTDSGFAVGDAGRSCVIKIKHGGIASSVKDNEIITQTMHFDKRNTVHNRLITVSADIVHQSQRRQCWAAGAQ